MENEKAPLTGWRVGDAGLTVFGPKTGAPSPRVLLTGKDRDVVRLAGAAPDLLAALKEAVRELDSRGLFYGPEFAKMRAAIARAEGQEPGSLPLFKDSGFCRAHGALDCPPCFAEARARRASGAR